MKMCLWFGSHEDDTRGVEVVKKSYKIYKITGEN